VRQKTVLGWSGNNVSVKKDGKIPIIMQLAMIRHI